MRFYDIIIQPVFSILKESGKLRHVRWKISLQRCLESGNGCALQWGWAREFGGMPLLNESVETWTKESMTETLPLL